MMNAKIAALVLFCAATACAGSKTEVSIASAPAAVASADFDACVSAKVDSFDVAMIERAIDSAEQGSDACAGYAQRALFGYMMTIGSAAMSDVELTSIQAVYARAHSVFGTPALGRTADRLASMLALRTQALYAVQN
jgi:hypothetical protein